MATVAAIFDDSVALENAINKLQDAGLGNDIVDIEEGREADVAPEQTVTEDTYDDGGVVPPLGGGAGAGGVAQTQGAPGLFAGVFSGTDGRNLDRLGSEAETFRTAVERGGKLLMLETSDPDKAVVVLREAGAQQIHDPR